MPFHRIAFFILALTTSALAGIVGEDGRMTEEEYAKKTGEPLISIQDRFAATGVLRCKNFSASAQLTGNKDTITSSAHVFTDSKTCRTIDSPQTCIFITKRRGALVEIPVSKLIKSGYQCPKLPQNQDDWAVLKLQRTVEEITPYEISLFDRGITTGEKLISVSGFSIDFQRKILERGALKCPSRLSIVSR